MKLRLAKTEAESDAMDITPLIDVIFLLVLFFMFTSTFIEEAKVFKIQLPTAAAAELVERSDMGIVSISEDGKLAWGDEELDDVEQLQAKLKGVDKSQPVIIRCDRKCEYLKFVQVKNVLMIAGVETIFEEVGSGAKN